MVAPIGYAVARLIISVNGRRILSRTINKKYIGLAAQGVKTAAVRAGAKTATISSIGVKKTVNITVTRKQVVALTKAVLATAGTYLAMGVHKIKTVRKSKKNKLTKKQTSTLRKNGYVYITRNKKQIKVKR